MSKQAYVGTAHMHQDPCDVSIKTSTQLNKSFTIVAKFQYLGMMLTDKYCMLEEIKRSLDSGIAFYHSDQNFLFSHLLIKNTKIKIHRTI